MNPTQDQLNNRTLAATNGGSIPDTSTRSLSGVSTPGPDTSATDQLSSALNSSTSPQDSTIMQNYKTANTQSQAATTSEAGAISDEYQPQLDLTNQQNAASVTSAQEAQRGFATNTAALTQLQNTNAGRIRDLTNQMNQALLANNSAGAQRLSDLAVQEQASLTQARSNWVQSLTSLAGIQNQNYQNTIAGANLSISQSQEARAQAGFQTPEQQSVMSLATSYPDAGVTKSDTLAQATAKVQNSKSYQQNLSKGQADIKAAQAAAQASNASAGLSGAQAGLTAAQTAQQRTLTGLISPNSADTENDVNGLINGTEFPQDILDKYANATNGGDIAKSIISQAQAKGYDLSKGNLAGKAKANLNNSSTSGNPLTSLTSGFQSLFQPPASKTLTTPTASTNPAYNAYLQAIGQ